MTQAVSKAPPPPAKSAAGLEGIVAAKSAVCFIDGVAGRLVYRGYEIGDLVEHASFEEVAHLLWDDKLPSESELTQLKKDISKNMALPAHVAKLIENLPAQMQPMDALRTAVSALGAADPYLKSNEPDANRRKAIRLTAQFPDR